MKSFALFCTGLLILAVLFSGCTGSSPQAPATPTASPATATIAQTTPVTPPAITGTTWKLGWFDDTKGVWTSVAQGSTITASFGADGKVTGSGGCNEYSADYHLGTDPMIWIKRPEIGKKTCQSPTGVMDQESAYYTDLSWSEDYRIVNNQLAMFDRSGKKILLFDPL